MNVSRKKFFSIIGITALFSFLVSKQPIKVFSSLFKQKNKIAVKSNPLSVKRIKKV